jgi:hypothetical protein
MTCRTFELHTRFNKKHMVRDNDQMNYKFEASGEITVGQFVKCITFEEVGTRIQSHINIIFTKFY